MSLGVFFGVFFHILCLFYSNSIRLWQIPFFPMHGLVSCFRLALHVNQIYTLCVAPGINIGGKERKGGRKEGKQTEGRSEA